MSNDLAKLNRLRVNAGKPELKSWKASSAKLDEAIKGFEDQGFTDALPGANVDAKPVTDDPAVAKHLPKEDEEPQIRTNPEDREGPEKEEPAPAPKVTNGKAQLGKGLENEPMARQSRIAVQMAKEREKREEKEAKRAEKAAAKEEAKKPKKDKKKNGKKVELAKGQVDPKKDPEKAKRQQDHIEAKRKARGADKKPAKEKNENEITVADICRELDIDPKVGRNKLRRHKDKVSKLYAKGVTDGWTFPKAAKGELVKLLK